MLDNIKEKKESAEMLGGGPCTKCGCLAFDNPDKTKACVAIDPQTDPGLCLHSYAEHDIIPKSIE